MQKKVIGVAFSDFHSANWKQFNTDGQRLAILTKAFAGILGASMVFDCPILFCGDLNDHPKHIDNIVLQHLAHVSAGLKKVKKKIIGINGNHDFYTKSSKKNPAKGYMHHLESLGGPFNCIDYTNTDCRKYRVHGIPYINGNVDFQEAIEDAVANRAKDRGNILLIHTDLPGAIEPDGREVGTAENIGKRVRKLMGKFDLVLAGHIHKHQKLGDNIYMIGAPMQQRRSDAGTDCGYLVIYEDYTIEHIKLELPTFRYFTAGEDHEDTDDFWIELPPPITENVGTTTGSFEVTADRSKLARRFLQAKGIKSKTKRELLTSYLND